MREVLRIIASAAIILGSGYFGLLFASKLDIRVRQTEQFRLIIEQMGFSIGFLKLPVSDAFCRAAKSRQGTVGKVWMDAAEHITRDNLSPSAAFERSILCNRAGLCLTEEDLNILYEFASGIGHGDTDSEFSNIKAACARLKIAQSSAEGERERKGNMWRGLGFLVGIFAVVILF